MVKVYEINGITPVVHPTAYVHPSAVLIGDVIVGPRCYVGPLASMRGDFGRLVLEEGANLQDCCVMHGFPGDDTVVEVDGHIGHGAVLHGCRVKRNAMVGMNCVVMDQAVVGEDSIIAANSFIKAGMVIPPRSMVMAPPPRWCASWRTRKSPGRVSAPPNTTNWPCAPCRPCAKQRR
jgi:carbonic anhydrase/acetyltransferase-like protein (isoleucine patch superfamily)